MPHTAARCCNNQQQTPRAQQYVHVESFDTMRSRKARCQAPPDNPETGDTNHTRGRSCAAENIRGPDMYTSGTATTHHDDGQHSPSCTRQQATNLLGGTCTSMSVSCCCCCRSVRRILWQREPAPHQPRHGPSEGRGVPQSRMETGIRVKSISAQLAGMVVHRYLTAAWMGP